MSDETGWDVIPVAADLATVFVLTKNDLPNKRYCENVNLF